MSLAFRRSIPKNPSQNRERRSELLKSRGKGETWTAPEIDRSTFTVLIFIIKINKDNTKVNDGTPRQKRYQIPPHLAKAMAEDTADRYANDHRQMLTLSEVVAQAILLVDPLTVTERGRKVYDILERIASGLESSSDLFKMRSNEYYRVGQGLDKYQPERRGAWHPADSLLEEEE